MLKPRRCKPTAKNKKLLKFEMCLNKLVEAIQSLSYFSEEESSLHIIELQVLGESSSPLLFST